MELNRRAGSLLAGLGLLLGTACGGSGEAAAPSTTAAPQTTSVASTAPPVTSSATSAPPATTAATAATTTTTLAAGPVTFSPLAGGEILVEATQAYNNPGVVIQHDGLWHMFSNDFRAWPGIIKVRHYTSDDGIVWQEATGTIFTSEKSPFGTPQITVGGYVSDQGRWNLYFHTFEGLSRPSVIGRATANDPAGPWTVHADPVLEPGAEGTWDALRVTRPSIVVVDGEIRLYYLGQDGEEVAAVGLATSEDGVVFTKRPDPVLQRAGWEESLERPDVVLTADGYVMIYRGTVGGPMGIATSSDGITWTRIADEPAFLEDREVQRSFFQGELAWSEEAGLRFYLEAGGGRSTNVYGWSFELP